MTKVRKFRVDKSCSHCHKIFTAKSALAKWCQDCQHNLGKWYINRLNPEERVCRLLGPAKNRAKTKGLSYNLDKEHILELFRKYEGRCCLTNIKFEIGSYGTKGQVHPYAPSIDRIVPSLGYVKGNVRLIVYHLNVALSDFGTERFESLIYAYNSNKGVNVG